MKLLVCFKVVHDLDSVIADDWRRASDTAFDIDYTKKVINCFDESALEIALCMADRLKESNQGCETTALTVSRESVESFTKNLYAVNFCKVVHIRHQTDLAFNPRATAQIIARYARRQGVYDAILFGYEASVADSGQVPFLTAELLGLPCISRVVDMEAASGGIRATCQTDFGIVKTVVTKPAVYLIGNSRDHTYLRIPTLKEKLNAAKKEAETLGIDELGISGRDIKGYADSTVMQVFNDQKVRECVWIKAGTPEEQARILYENYIRRLDK